MNTAKYAGNMDWTDEALLDKWRKEQDMDDEEDAEDPWWEADEEDAEDPWWEADEYKGEQEDIGVWRP